MPDEPPKPLPFPPQPPPDADEDVIGVDLTHPLHALLGLAPPPRVRVPRDQHAPAPVVELRRTAAPQEHSEAPREPAQLELWPEHTPTRRRRRRKRARRLSA